MLYFDHKLLNFVNYLVKNKMLYLECANKILKIKMIIEMYAKIKNS